MTKLNESVPANNVKIIELFNKIDSGNLVTNPEFQRKLVWKKQHKFYFIETILKNFPFPEIYIASTEINVENLTTIEVVVDGQQRLTTIVDYIKGEGEFAIQNKIKRFNQLTDPEKKSFLNYTVSVRDLKDIQLEVIKEIFMRINNTEYSLNAVEKANAQYGDGEFVVFCKQIIDKEYTPTNDLTDVVIEPVLKKRMNDFFEKMSVFNDTDRSRMNDLQYIMTLVATIIESDYFSRNTKTNLYIERFNNEFENHSNILKTLEEVITFIEKIDLSSDSYWLNKPNLFNLIIELSTFDKSKINIITLRNQLKEFEMNSKKYFANTDLDKISADAKKYYEFAKEGINEKAARIHRAKIISEILKKSLNS